MGDSGGDAGEGRQVHVEGGRERGAVAGGAKPQVGGLVQVRPHFTWKAREKTHIGHAHVTEQLPPQTSSSCSSHRCSPSALTGVHGSVFDLIQSLAKSSSGLCVCLFAIIYRPLASLLPLVWSRVSSLSRSLTKVSYPGVSILPSGTFRVISPTPVLRSVTPVPPEFSLSSLALQD